MRPYQSLPAAPDITAEARAVEAVTLLADRILSAVASGQVEVIGDEIRNNRNIANEVNRQGQTLLHLLALAEKHDFSQQVRQWAEAGLPMNSVDHKGKTAVHLACESGNQLAVIMLIAGKADPYGFDKRGYRPADLAAESGKLNVLYVLEQLGVETVKPLERLESPEIALLLLNAVENGLIDKDNSLNYQQLRVWKHAENIAIFTAYANEDFHYLNMMLRHGFSMKNGRMFALMKDYGGRFLQKIITNKNGSAAAVSWLLEHSYREEFLKQRDKDDNTLLHLATAKDRKDIVQLLIGAIPADEFNSSYQTVTDIALSVAGESLELFVGSDVATAIRASLQEM